MKIVVDKIPKSGEECLFSELIGMTGKRKCIFKTGLYSRCSIDCKEECEYLISGKWEKENEEGVIDCIHDCKECSKKYQLPFGYCCLIECGQHEFCRGCKKGIYLKGEVK